MKTQYLTMEMKKYRPTGPTQQELMKIFHTTRHVFDPKFVCFLCVQFMRNVMMYWISFCLLIAADGGSGCHGDTGIVFIAVSLW